MIIYTHIYNMFVVLELSEGLGGRWERKRETSMHKDGITKCTESH
jgi:hypothetical protein